MSPSPYGRQRPRTTRVPRPPSARATSCDSRLLPIPGGPTTVTRFGRRSRTVRSNRMRRSPTSASRPTNGVSSAAAAPTDGPPSPSTRHRRIGRSIPLTVSSPRSVNAKAVRVSRWVRSPTTTRPGSARAWSRAATFTASPVTMPSSVPWAITSPVLIADAHGELAARARRELRAQGGQAPVHRERAPDGAHGIVLVRDRGAERGDHRVADELLHRPAEPVDLLGHRVEVGTQHGAQVLGIQARRHLGRGGQVGEEHGDDLALLDLHAGRRRIEGRAAAPAEAVAGKVLRPAGGARPDEGRPAGAAEAVRRRVGGAAARTRDVGHASAPSDGDRSGGRNRTSIEGSKGPRLAVRRPRIGRIIPARRSAGPR